ncbi:MULTISPECIES: cell envelope integrity protein CreD [unclassified Bosea (in: a-proteobacteria)]|uniref:cell envelope integrity protein CreD n=1 Tax=unclassified Bosea (in: a-proteobacteria) TaxID=2653178 RepID=UPI000F75EDF6|nr:MULTISPECIES: cell envelope integrity protein CreD [unclassified Bosea (in: a-proteobacteria)]AZO80070.1 hypothetical protein BLM15_22610 [Bosea sp. Tri-49]RXT22854.1 cell envelope integrity protein CreD [Bosea sp. Tri-39]RXT38323.1 cell envelope integrity protein CreD [Bosea sp. Tri-54]
MSQEQEHQNESKPEPPAFPAGINPRRFGRSPGLKFFVIGFLALLLLIPLMFVSGLRSERSATASQAAREIGEAWGREQIVGGPVLMVPYLVPPKIANAAPTREVAVFLPDDLQASSEAQTEIRRRSIFDVPVYRGKVTLNARFLPPDFKAITSDTVQPLWNEAVLAVGVADVRGLKNRATAQIRDGAVIEFEPTFGAGIREGNGIHAALREVDLTKPLSVQVALDLNGSRSLSIVPLAKNSAIRMSSNWQHPSFSGAHLPDDRVIDANGFSASWRVSHLARNLPLAFSHDNRRTDATFLAGSVGARFYQPVDLYQLVDRAIKYAILFVGAVFLAVFGLELVARDNLHAVQYTLVGFALVLFYVLLLSLAEHLGFLTAYLVAAAATTALIALYIGLVLRSFARGAVLGLILTTGYGLVYALLKSEDFALLAGAIGAFVALATLMLATARVNWSGLGDSVAKTVTSDPARPTAPV